MSTNRKRQSVLRVRYSRESRRCARVDVIPLIDVIFLLLSFFILLTISMVFQRGIPLNLATAQSAAPADESFVVVSVSRSGAYFYNNEAVSEGELRSKLANLRLEGYQEPVVLRADAESSHQMVTSVLDLVRQSGFSNVMLAVEQQK